MFQNLKRKLGLGLLAAAASASMAPVASAQVSSSGLGSTIVGGICNIIGPFVGPSPILSVVLVLMFGTFLVMWLLNENKEGVIIWVLRSGVVVMLLINLLSIPHYLGLPGVCGG